MKWYSLFLVAALATVSSYGQEANTLSFGANFLSGQVRDGQKQKTFEQNIQARVSFFATKQLAMGLCLETGAHRDQHIPFGMSFLSRWHFNHKPNQTVRYFVEAGAGVADHQLPQIPEANIDPNWIQPAVYVQPGICIFPCRLVAIELAAEYKYIGGADAASRLGLSLGVKMFLSEKDFKGTFPNEFRSLY